MKFLLIWIIKLYKKIPGSWHGACKYQPTCSTYAIDAIKKYGALKGSIMAIKRICRCNPWHEGGYDPVK